MAMADVKVRMATYRGDLLLTWRENEIHVDGRLSMQKERDDLQTLAEKHGLAIEGDLAGHATLVGKRERLETALLELIGRKIGAAGYAVYSVNRKGEGRVLYSKRDLDLADTKEVATVPRTVGG